MPQQLLSPYRQLDAPIARSSSRQCRAGPQDAHADEGENHTQSAIVRELQAFSKKLQSNTGHDASSDSKHATISTLADCNIFLTGDLEDECCDTGTQRLTDATEKRCPEHSLQAVVDSKVKRKGEDETIGDVVDKQSEEDREAEFGIGVVRCKGYEAFGKLVQGNSNGSL